MKKGTAPLLEVSAALMLGVAILAAGTGGWRAEVAGVTLSVRAVWRPLLVVALLLVARWFVARDGATRVTVFSAAAARVVAGACLVAGVLGWTACLSPYAGGADSYGYVSAAERIRDGTLIHHEPLAAILPYADGIGPATPLGYVRAPHVPESNVPAYPLGLPALMALAAAAFGPQAPFLVPLALGLVLIATCVWFTRLWTGDVTTALAAGAAVAWHPVVFTYAIQPMSDVPAAALYVATAALLMNNRVPMAVAAGLAGSAAFLVRPALLPGVAALALLPLTTGTSRRWRVIAFIGIVLAGGGLQGWLQSYLYGSPFANGYGPPAELFSLRFLNANLRSYSYWGAVLNGPLWIGGLVAGFYVLRRSSARVLVLATIIALALPYAIYRPYDHWLTLRFILPFLLVSTLIAVVGLVSLPRRLAGHQLGTWIGLSLVVVMIVFWVRWLDREQMFVLVRSEERYIQAAELVTRTTPDTAVILASLHSGSLRYYTGRQTLDWGKIPKGQFDATVDALERRGFRVFLLFDGEGEHNELVSRHGDVVNQGRWLPSGQRRDIRLHERLAPVAGR
jgi:hypothetical protein